MKFTIKIGKIDGVKSDGKVQWSSEKKAGEIKIHYEGGQKIFIVGLGKDQLINAEFQKISAKIGKKAKEEEIKNLALSCPKTGRHPAEVVAEALVEGLLLGEYEFRKYKTHETNLSNLTNLEEVIILVKNANEALKVREEIVRAEIYSRATSLARDLVNEPSSLTTPSYLAHLAEKLGKENGFKTKCTSIRFVRGNGCDNY